MREIKFRVWCKNKNEWESDPVIINKEGLMIDPKHGMTYSSETHIVQQFTGLTTRDGQEIYEGDVVRVETLGINYSGGKVNGVVEFIDGCFTVVFSEPVYDISMKCHRPSLYVKCFVINHAIEVIGHKYDRPNPAVEVVAQ